ncbi:hypothetical protein [Spirosoma litoris]
MDTSKQKLAVSTFLQEIALLLLASQPIKSKLQEAADKSRGRILADLKPEERELYLASRDIILTLSRQLANCQNMDMLMKVLQIVQGITEGSVTEYKEVESQLIEA